MEYQLSLLNHALEGKNTKSTKLLDHSKECEMAEDCKQCSMRMLSNVFKPHRHAIDCSSVFGCKYPFCKNIKRIIFQKMKCEKCEKSKKSKNSKRQRLSSLRNHIFHHMPKNLKKEDVKEDLVMQKLEIKIEIKPEPVDKQEGYINSPKMEDMIESKHRVKSEHTLEETSKTPSNLTDLEYNIKKEIGNEELFPEFEIKTKFKPDQVDQHEYYENTDNNNNTVKFEFPVDEYSNLDIYDDYNATLASLVSDKANTRKRLGKISKKAKKRRKEKNMIKFMFYHPENSSAPPSSTCQIPSMPPVFNPQMPVPSTYWVREQLLAWRLEPEPV